MNSRVSGLDGRKHPRHRLDDALITPVRFSVMAAVSTDAEIDFATLRDILETDDSALSKAITHLLDTGYVSVRKGYVANRPRTWITGTAAGKAAMAAHLSALQDIAGNIR